MRKCIPADYKKCILNSDIKSIRTTINNIKKDNNNSKQINIYIYTSIYTYINIHIHKAIKVV